MIHKTKRTPTAVLFATCASTLVLTGCFTEFDIEDDTPTAATQCESQTLQNGLCQANQSEVIDWLAKNFENQQRNVVYELNSAEAGVQTVQDFDAVAAPATDNIEASETNTIEDGVDESDWVKVIDNRYLATPKQPKVDYQYVWKENTAKQKQDCQDNYFDGGFFIEPSVQVDSIVDTIEIDSKTSEPYFYNWCEGRWELDDIYITEGELKVFEMIQTPASSAIISNTKLNPYSNYVSGLYDVLDDTGLLVLSSLSDELPEMRSNYGWWHNKSGIDMIDVSDPINPQANWSIKLDGYIVDTRVLNDELFVVSRRSPYEFYQFADTLNTDALNSIPTNKLMGTIQLNDEAPQLLSPIETCLLPKDERPAWGITFTYLTKIDLTDPSNIQTVCTLAPMHSIYMNEEAVYFLTTDYNWRNDDNRVKTNLDRFDLNTLNYTGSLYTDGSLGWGIDSKFRIKEQTLNEQQVLTLILTEQNSNNREHYIRNFEVNGSEFTQLDVYPEAGEKAIGKEREDIFSARIDGNSVQIVTYLNSDPLYEFNISDPSNIWMESELEIPGFSTYLHNIEDTELTVGLGQTDDRRLKIELYDQTGTDSSVLGTIELDSRTYSPATWDYKAFTSINDAENQLFRIAIPIQRWGYNDWTVNSETYYTNMAGIWLIQVDYSTSPATITQVNEIEVTDQPRDVYQSRAVIRGSAVHYAINGEVFSVDFSETTDVHSSAQ
ncbi:beta-propeller domain-containing protein [Marinicellulosiphila megalodicopiae]|uniref:beta-propeller domain-containing protein n=1 Tax=Marinicellulosiphila megalodicopiae TaxID=2724896 RepID=UPI003BAEE591